MSSSRSVLIRAFLLTTLALTGVTPALAGDPMEPAELADKLEAGQSQNLLVLDVRTPEEYALGHIPGALLIPHDALEQRLPELEGSRQIVVYCRTGRRSTEAEQLLRKRGYQVEQLKGSWQAWQAAGLPVETQEEPAQ